MTNPPDEGTHVPPPLVVERRGNWLWVDGRSYGPDDKTTHAYARRIAKRGRVGSASAAAVVDFLDSAAQRARHAEGAFPDEGTDVPPPRRPAVELRTEVAVNGVQVGALVVVVPPSAPDTTTAVQDATRALHDGALAVARVLAIEPADRAGATS